MNDQTAAAPPPTDFGPPVPGTARISPRIDAFMHEVLPPEKAAPLFKTLGGGLTPDRFKRNLALALMERQEILEMPAIYVFREVYKAAALGLSLDPQLGEAYIIIAYDGKTKRKLPQLRVGYRGMCRLVRQADDVANIYAHEVHANDFIDCDLGVDKRLVHKPKLFTDRGPIIGYYAVVKYKDGNSDFEPMTKEQCLAIRDRSDGWKAFQGGFIKGTPWATDEVEMCRKTVLRRLLKRQPQSSDVADAIRIEDHAEFPDMNEQLVIAAPTPPPPSETGRTITDTTELEGQPGDRIVLDDPHAEPEEKTEPTKTEPTPPQDTQVTKDNSVKPTGPMPPPPPPRPTKAPRAQPAGASGATTATPPAPPTPPPAGGATNAPPTQASPPDPFLSSGETFDIAQWKGFVSRRIEDATDADQLIDLQNTFCIPHRDKIDQHTWNWHVEAIRGKLGRLKDPDTFDGIYWVAHDLAGALAGVDDVEQLKEVKEKIVLPAKSKLTAAQWQDACAAYNTRYKEITADTPLE